MRQKSRLTSKPSYTVGKKKICIGEITLKKKSLLLRKEVGKGTGRPVELLLQARGGGRL